MSRTSTIFSSYEWVVTKFKVAMHHITALRNSLSGRQNTILDFRLGDCLEGMRALAPGSVDLVVTSPPYNLGIRYSAYKDDQARDQYLGWCEEWGQEVARVLKTDGSFFLNVGAAPSNPMLPHELADLFGRGLFHLQNSIHWIKAITIDDVEEVEPFSRGHFKPISSPRFLNDCHEHVFHFTKGGKTPIDRLAIGVPYADKSNVARWGHTHGRDVRCRGNTWFIPYKTIRNRQSERPHPATFPPALVGTCILLHGGLADMTMMDPFLGIGNAALAAQSLCIKRFIGFEIDPGYIALAKEATGAKVTILKVGV